jgi:hypothetical protein
MWDYLKEANTDLLYQIEVVQEIVGNTKVAGELTPYVGRVSQLCADLRLQAKRNLQDVEHRVPSTLTDILAATQGLTEFFELVNTRLAIPIVRAKGEDRLALVFLRFLHDSNSKSAPLPYGITDGNFAVYPTLVIPPVYLLPVTRQTTLLYLPLVYHEFGHVLYALHKQELDDLVQDFQKVVDRSLIPQSIRGSSGASAGVFRRRVVTAWYAWAQEFYCDAVGLTIGGPSFLKAFSHFFRTRSVHQYYLPREEQLKGRHPVTWLRAKLLTGRARKYGYVELADSVDRAWQETANTLNLVEDYEGTWRDEYLVPARQMLDDMVEESQPYAHSQSDVGVDAALPRLNPVQLCNLAWEQFEREPSIYRHWERSSIEQFLKVY